MRKNTRVCFQVDVVKNHTDWKSVLVLGEYQELEDEGEQNDAMKAFLDRRLLLKISERTLSGSGEESDKTEFNKANRPAIYRIVIDEKSGRYEND